MGIPDKYSLEVRQIIVCAREEAQRLRHRIIGSEHLLLGVLRLHIPLIEGLFASLHVSTTSIAQALDFVMGRGNRAILSESTLGAGARAILARAEEHAVWEQAAQVSIEHLFMALLEEENGIAAGVLESFGISTDVARDQFSTLARGGYERLHLATMWHTYYETTPTLNQVSRDLTIAALDDLIDPLIGRDAELERMIQILSRRTKNNPALIGPAGVGKTALAEGLALCIVQGNVPEHLQQYRVVALDVGLLSVCTRFRGDFEERLKRIMQEVLKNPNLIIFIDEMHTLVQTGVAEGSIDASNLFKPMLARGEFRCIGATTLEEYRRTVEADPALERRFQPILINETSTSDTLAVLRGLRPRYEAFHRVTISDNALLAAVKMSERYIHHRFQPDKALDLLDEAAARVCVRRTVLPDSAHRLRETLVALQREKDQMIARHDFALAALLRRRERQLYQFLWQAEDEWQRRSRQLRPFVREQDIAEVVSLWTGIPVAQIVDEERTRLLRLEEILHQRVIGQHEAVQALARAVRRSRAQLRDIRRPIGSFIFIGSTGVGKTELARALASALFDNEDALLKFDMSEFMESHYVSRLIGAPPGYVGYDQAGLLTEAVRRRPYRVILFDEIEKAHPKFFDLLLQILEDGQLTDARGLTVDFRHTIIILTSNSRTSSHKSCSMTFTTRRDEHHGWTEQYQRMCSLLPAMLREVFRPELLNRIDETIVFHPLEPSHLREILKLLLAGTQRKLADRSITLQVSDAAREFLVARGYSAEYGARSLRRTVQELLDDLLADAILRGTLRAGSFVSVDVVDGQLHLHPTEQVAHTAPAKNGEHGGHAAA